MTSFARRVIPSRPHSILHAVKLLPSLPNFARSQFCFSTSIPSQHKSSLVPVVVGAAGALSVAALWHQCYMKPKTDVSEECLIVDTDVGIDDLAAIMLLVAHGAPIRLITTVHGSCEESLCESSLGTSLIRRLVATFDMQNVPVVRGASLPDPKNRYSPGWLTRHRLKLEEVAQTLGFIDDTQSHGSLCLEGMPAESSIINIASQYSQPVTILALGPLTNIAAAARSDPAQFVKHVGTVVIAADTFKDKPFNVRLDPPAVQTILDTGIPVKFVGTRCRPAFGHDNAKTWVDEVLPEYVMQESVRIAAGDAQGKAASMLRKLAQWHPLGLCQDPISAAYVLNKEAYRCEKRPLQVVNAGLSLRSLEACESPDACQISEAQGLDFKEFTSLVKSAMRLTDEPSTMR